MYAELFDFPAPAVFKYGLSQSPKAKIRFHHDFETASEADLPKVGQSRYARHATTRALMLAFAFDDEPVRQWVPAHGEPMPRDVRDAMRDPDVVKFAWNKGFEWAIWTHTLDMRTPHTEWRDPMVLAFSLSLPGSLDKAGQVVELPQDKLKHARGKTLVRKFTKPRKPTKTKPWTWATRETDPAEWEEFLSYNRGDVEAERAFWLRCRKWNLPRHEWDLWHLDQEINEAGLPINLRVVDAALRLNSEVVTTRLGRMRALTDLDNPNSGAQLLPWLQDQGYPYEDLKKGHVSRALEALDEACQADPAMEPATRDYRQVLGLRQEVSKASVKKYQALKLATDDDGRLRNTLQFAGAGRTWRWAGRKYQAQNLARPVWYLEKFQVEAVTHLEKLDPWSIEQLYPYPMDLLSTCVRPVVQAPEGMVFLDADLNAIENRVLGWISDCQKILDVFRNKRDPYIDFATYMFGRTYADLWHDYKVLGMKAERTTSKPAVLGCGYMLGAGEERENQTTGEIEATGLLGYAWNMGVKLTAAQSKQSVDVWRGTFKEAVDFWWLIDRAAKKCVRTGLPTEANMIRFDRHGPWLRMILPSGRALHYCRPRLEEKMTPWGAMKETLTYEGLNDKNQWVRISTHPGKLTENADQAIARDLLAHGMMLARKRGLDIRLHVHDQILAVSPEDQAERNLRILIECMEEPPPWTGNGLPLGSEGHISRYFVKD